MTTLMLPQRFVAGGVTVYFDGSTGITAQVARIPTPAVEDKTIQLAGGYIIDADYGARANLRPAPFSFTIAIQATEPATVTMLLEPILDHTSGAYGASGTFYAFKHGIAGPLKSCIARLVAVEKDLQPLDMTGPFVSTLLDGVRLTFKPTTLFV